MSSYIKSTAALVACCAASVVADGPEQVHLAYGLTPGTVRVSWATTSDSGAHHAVMYGPAGSGNLTSTAAGDQRPLAILGSGRRNTHVATLEGLEEGQSYEYKVVEDSLESEVFTFTLKKEHHDTGPDLHVVFGDMGASHAFSLCLACNASSTVCDAEACAGNTTVGLVSEVDEAAMFLHVGDFAYNFDSDSGKTGDQFMNNIEQVAARLPYMISHGNHEDSPANLAHFTERWRNMPSNTTPYTTLAGKSVNNPLYYSWDSGLVHYIAVSTELWFGVGLEIGVELKSQLEWLEEDLKAANANRDNVPWVIAHSHRDMYVVSCKQA